jgi:hypothetical protein
MDHHGSSWIIMDHHGSSWIILHSPAGIWQHPVAVAGALMAEQSRTKLNKVEQS